MENPSKVLQKAVDSEGVHLRGDVNHRLGENDFDCWVKTLIAEVNFTTVLDVCCGTGNQLVLYAQAHEVERLVGVDLSQDSLQIAKSRLGQLTFGNELVLKSLKMETMFEDSQLNAMQFDLISCFYGLYYSQDLAGTLASIYAHLNPGGTFLVVGPYGPNNAAFFELLQRHFPLPELVLRSSTTFMEQEVLPFFQKKGLGEVTTEVFVNRIVYPAVSDLMQYWKNSTFYEARFEPAVMADLTAHFERHPQFVIEKHVMACKVRKNDP